MYDSPGFTGRSFGLFAALASSEPSRLINNIELLVDDVDEHLSSAVVSGVDGFSKEDIAELTDASEVAREVVMLIKNVSA